MKEIFDIVDRDDKVIGQATREECHNNNKIIHRGVFIIVINDKNEILIQKRTADKDLYPSLLDVSAAGHVKTGETYEETARRELKEELGIKPNQLSYIGKIFFEQEKETEFDAIFLTKTDKKIDKIKFDKVEVESIIFIPIKDIKDMIKKNKNMFVPKIDMVVDKFLKVYKDA